MYEDIYSAYHVGLKPPRITKKQVKPCLKELKGYGVNKKERKNAVINALRMAKNA